jgi:hypothetical protein
MSATVALAAAACTNATASPSPSASVDCSQSLKDRVAQVDKADAAVDEDTKAVTKAKGTPDEAAAQKKLDADKATDKKLQDEEKACASPSTSASPSPSPSASFNAKSFTDQLNKVFPGFKLGSTLVVGEGNIDWTNHTETRGLAAFSTKTLKTQADVAAFLNGSSAQSKAAKARVVAAYKGQSQSDLNNALNGSAYFPVQAKVAAQILGTTYFQDGKVLDENGQWRNVGPNDVYWLPVTTSGQIIFGAAIRADCGNPNLVKMVPQTPKSPPAPPIECATNCHPQPPCKVCSTPPPVCTQHCSTPPPPCHCTPPPPCSVCVTKASASPTVDRNPPAGPSGAPTAAPSSNFPGPTPVKDSPAPTPVPSPGYSGPPPGGSKCNPPSQSCTTGPSNPPSGTPEPVAPTQPGGGGNNSAPPSASPTEACGPLTDPYVPC